MATTKSGFRSRLAGKEFRTVTLPNPATGTIISIDIKRDMTIDRAHLDVELTEHARVDDYDALQSSSWSSTRSTAPRKTSLAASERSSRRRERSSQPRR